MPKPGETHHGAAERGDFRKSRRQFGPPPKNMEGKRKDRTGYENMALERLQEEYPGAPKSVLMKKYNNESHSAYIQRIAREHGPDMIDVLVKISKDERHAPGARVAAAGMVLDRAYGKPSQTIETITAQTALHEIPTEMLVQLIQKASQERAFEEANRIAQGLPAKDPEALPEPTVLASDGQEA